MSGKNGKPNHSDPLVDKIKARQRALSPQQASAEAQPFSGETHVHIHGLVIQLPEIKVPATEVTVHVDPARVEVSPADRTVSFMRDDMGRIQAATVKETKH
jgi:hypothetical protein